MKISYLAFCAGIMLSCLIGCKKDAAKRTVDPPPRVFPVQPPPAAGQNADSIPETYPAVQTAIKDSVNSAVAGFYEAVPALYKYSTRKYPLLISIHGVEAMGNGTTDLPKVLDKGIPALLNEWVFPPAFRLGQEEYSFVVISPQFRTKPSPRLINDLVDYAVRHYRIDTSRIYISGFSWGGGLTWDYSVEYGNRLAAAVPISGLNSFVNDTRATKIADSNLPVWAFHNEDDPTVPVSTTLQFVDMISSHNPEPLPRKTIWAKGGHDAWTKATDPNYKEDGMNIYEWMLHYTR